MKTYLKATLSKLEMDDPIELNKQVVLEEELKRQREEQAELDEIKQNEL